jgi:hypothetical protein
MICPIKKEGPCSEAKLLALHTSMVCLVRSLAISGHLDRSIYRAELDRGRQWLQAHCGQHEHEVQAFDQLLEMLKDA